MCHSNWFNKKMNGTGDTGKKKHESQGNTEEPCHIVDEVTSLDPCGIL